MSTQAVLNCHFQSKRFEFRDFTMQDFDFVHAYASDGEVVKYQAWGPNTLDQTKLFLKEVIGEAKEKTRNIYNLALIRKSDRMLIGGILAKFNPDELIVEIGFSLVRNIWGQGVAKESVKALLEFIPSKFPSCKLIEATCDSRNIASSKVLEANGFQRIKIILNHMMLRDGPRDTFLYQLPMVQVKRA